MKESDVEKQVVDWVIDMGGKAVKLKDESEIGFPDRTIFLPNGEIILTELKHPKKGRTSHMQHMWYSRLRKLDFAVGFCRSLDEVIQLYERHYK